MAQRGSRFLGGWWHASILVAFAALATAPGVRAHDFWILPSNFAPAVGEPISFRLAVGQQWLGDPFPRSNQRIVRFALAGPAGVADIPGVEAVDPAGVERLSAPGYYVAGYASTNAPLSLPAAKFEEYLRLEGLDWVIAERARRGESQADSREVYARCAKALVHVPGEPNGRTTAKGWNFTFGFTLEIVPERAPDTLRPGETLPLRLLYRGRPLAGALVVLMPKTSPQAAVEARSDRAGRVRLPLATPGVWMAKAVHMVRLTGADAQREAADWQSYWASLTFETPAR